MGYSPQGCKELDTTERLHVTSQLKKFGFPLKIIHILPTINRKSTDPQPLSAVI